MRIGIDASRLRNGMSGIGRYIYNILEPLDSQLPNATFVMYTRSDLDLRLPSNRWIVRRDTHPIWSHLPTLWWTHFRMGKLARRDRLNVFWAANTLLPRGMQAVPCITTIYDLNHLLAPETMPLLSRLAYKAWFASAVRYAAYRVAISQGTSSRLKSKFGQSADAIALPALPIRSSSPGREDAQRLIDGLGVKLPYILTVGTQEPRKNLLAVVNAMTIQKEQGRLGGHQLVMAGAQGWGNALSKDRQHAGFEWIKPLGYVDDDALVALYTLADAFVFPSTYEGYGIPVSEALAYGCPVVATDLPELREAGSFGVIYVEPTLQGFAEGLNKALARPRPQAVLPRHDWSSAAKVMGDAIFEVAK